MELLVTQAACTADPFPFLDGLGLAPGLPHASCLRPQIGTIGSAERKHSTMLIVRIVEF